MSSGLIFITGATGFIGIATALQAVQAGYRLRIAVRQASQVDKVKTALSGYSSKLEFVIVPDITDRAAYAGKLDGVDYVLHIASPAPQTLNKKDIFEPAVKGTLNVLEEALKVATIRKVVITSSILSMIPLTGVPEGETVTGENAWDITVDENADIIGPNDATTAFLLYHASKILANTAAWRFKEQNNPHYALVTIHPTFVYGHDLHQTTADGIGSTNRQLWAALVTGDASVFSSYVNVHDVATAHVRSLDSSVLDGSKYVIAAKDTTWKEAAQILKKNYPEVQLFKLSEDTPGKPLPMDASKAERELHIEWASLEDTIKEVVDQNLGLMDVRA